MHTDASSCMSPTLQSCISKPSRIRTHTHTHAHTHTNTHAHTHTHTHTHKHAHTHTQTHTHAHPHAHTQHHRSNGLEQEQLEDWCAVQGPPAMPPCMPHAKFGHDPVSGRPFTAPFPPPPPKSAHSLISSRTAPQGSRYPMCGCVGLCVCVCVCVCMYFVCVCVSLCIHV